MSESDKSDRVRQGIIHVQTEYRKMAGLIAGLSLATLGLPVVFFKDIFGINISQGKSILSTVMIADNKWFVSLFVISYMLIALVFHNLYCYSVYNVTMTRKTLSANDPKQMWIEERRAEDMLDLYFGRAAVLFISGVIAMILALLIFVKP